MRNGLISLAAALLLASAPTIAAQTQRQPATPASTPATSPAAPGSFDNTIDVGFRGTTTDGDEARFERYRDTRNGAYTSVLFGKRTESYWFDASAKNIGYHDQRYTLGYQRSKLRFNFAFDAIPLNYCYICSTPWVEASPNVWTLDAAIRQQVQRSRYPAPVVPLPAGTTSLAGTAAQAQLVSVYRPIAQPFDIQTRRDTANVKLAYDVDPDVAITGGFQSTHKSGHQPFGMSFAFNNANELPMHVDNRTNDMSLGIEWVKPQGMFRAAYDYSNFSNQFNEVVWDNPFQAQDFSNGLTPPLGPYDPNGYVGGNGPARGRISQAPDNFQAVVSFTGLYKITRTSSLNGTIQIIDQSQNDALIPWTTNAVINQPLVWAAFPNLAALPRESAEAKVRAANALLNFSSKVNNLVNVTARYRHNSHVNVTRPFDAVEYVRFDAVPEEIGSESEGHDIVRDTLDAYIGFKALHFSQLRLGYGYDNFSRTGRAHNDMRDQAFRVTWDTTGYQYASLRVLYEHVARRGFGFSEMAIEDGGAQPGLRFYDEADRDRNRVNFMVTVNPLDKIELTAQTNYLKDDYNGPGLEFGLLNSKNTQYGFGASFMPTAAIDFGINYGRDTMAGFQKSRNANPPPDPTWTDRTRDWTMDNEEKVNNFDLFVNLAKPVKNTDVSLNYTFADSDNAFVFGGPRVDPSVAGSLAALGQFEPLPNVTNKWRQLRADLRYFVNSRFGVGLGWWYEKFDVTDFATIDLPGQPGVPRIDYLGEISTGYGNRPYKGNTVTVRLLAHF